MLAEAAIAPARNGDGHVSYPRRALWRRWLAARHVLLLSIAIWSLTTGGCTRISSQTGGATHSWTIPGVLRVGFYESLDNLNPLLSLQTYVGQVETLIFSGLVQYDDHYRLVPDAAAVVPTLANGGVSKDGVTITYRLRHDVRFSDGTP